MAAEVTDPALDRPGSSAPVEPEAVEPDAVGPEAEGTASVDSDAARARLAAGQIALVTALVAGGAEPAGFDPGALEATRRVLVDKRRAGVARRWPTLAAEPEFGARFRSWAAGRPPAGAYADGVAFGQAHRDELSEDARVELLRARCVRRRLAVLVDRAAGGALLAVRAPGLGTVILRAPF